MLIGFILDPTLRFVKNMYLYQSSCNQMYQLILAFSQCLYDGELYVNTAKAIRMY
jgi:hypothetical protein